MDNVTVDQEKFKARISQLAREDRSKFSEFMKSINSSITDDTLGLISDLSDQEYDLFMDILSESIVHDSSELLEDLYLEDYDEIPVDFETFITSNEYLGNSFRQGDGLYPYWRDTFSNKIFNPGSPVVEVLLQGSIGSGKSTVSVVGIMYILYKLLCLKNPATHYRLAEGSRIAVALFNMTADSVYGIGWDKIQSYAKASPWFLRNGELVGRPSLRLNKLIAEDRLDEISKADLADCTWNPNKGIVIKSGSKASHFTGYDVFCMVGSTEIHTSEGIRTLEELSGSKARVATRNSDGTYEYSSEVDIVETKVVTELIEIELDDGTVLRCTPEHQLMLKSGEYVRADELTESDELMEVEVDE